MSKLRPDAPSPERAQSWSGNPDTAAEEAAEAHAPPAQQDQPAGSDADQTDVDYWDYLEP